MIGLQAVAGTPPAWKAHLTLIAGLSLLILISIYCWDQSIVWFFVEQNTRHYAWLLHPLQALPEHLVILLPLLMVISLLSLCFYRLFASKTLSVSWCRPQVMTYLLQFSLHTSVLLLIGLGLKIGLKFVFARTWPDTFKADNPSLLNDGVYGFFWFEPGVWYQAFPSGHTISAAVFALLLAAYYPLLRFLALFFVFVVGGSLIVLYYHFLADVLAGLLCAYMLVFVSLKLLERSS